MLNIGEFNELKVVRKASFGYYLDRGTKKSSDDILLPNGNTEGKEINIGDVVNAFIYRDSRDRLIATLKTPLAILGDVAYLEVTQITNFGAFINFGLERDILIPLREQKYKLEEGRKYLVYIYLDKTGRLAATTDVDKYLDEMEDVKLMSDVEGVVYGYQTNGSLRVAVDNKYRAVVLKNEYFTKIFPGDIVKGKIKRVYEDGIIGLSLRQYKLKEKDDLEKRILEYLKENGGEMIYNDKSSPDDIKRQFKTSKNYFKMALGGLMKKNLIEQGSFGTKLKE